MSPLPIPPELKKITQYVRRAEELQAQVTPKQKIVSFYCFQYACQIGIPLASTPAAKKCIGQILDILETDRSKMENFTKAEKYSICREFSMSVFDKADSEDRSGLSDKNTAKTFYASATFLDILKQFHNMDEETDEMIEEEKKSFYAKWKATEILKAIKEGRDIKPGGYGTEEPDDTDDEQEVTPHDDGKVLMTKEKDPVAPPSPPSSSTYEYASTSKSLPSTPPPSYEEHFTPIAPPFDDVVQDSIFSIPIAPMQSLPKLSQPSPNPATTVMENVSTFFGIKHKKIDAATYQDAKELTIFALKALEEKDGETAVLRLKEALELMHCST